MSIPVLSPNADIRSITERVNKLLAIQNFAHSSRLVADLPAASAAYLGWRTMVTDANATTFDSVVAGGGANTIGVRCDGADWRIA